MSTYQELLQQRADLEAKILEVRKAELADAVAKVRSIVAEYSLTPGDVFPTKGASSGSKSKVAPKYRDPVTGQTWTGRGKAPKWIQNEDREKFAI